ncbi:MAG: hypothetical protein ACM3ST_00845 [Bdellovibrio bacteriovorus]
MMQRCPFASALVTGLAACGQAVQVVRRGGAEYDCRSGADHGACSDLFERLKAAALPAFGVEDDLNTMPHSVLVKVQCGGLQGLARLSGQARDRIEDVATLRDRALGEHGGAEGLPIADLVADITAFRAERRGRRR